MNRIVLFLLTFTFGLAACIARVETSAPASPVEVVMPIKSRQGLVFVEFFAGL